MLQPKSMDQVVKEMSEALYKALIGEGVVESPLGPPTVHIPSDPMAYIGQPFVIDFDDHGCKHQWQNYVGFKEAYKFCTKCPEKRKLDEQ